MPSAGGTPARLTPDANGTTYPRWSPDGSKILFTQDDGQGTVGLFTEAASGGQPKLLLGTKLENRFESDRSPDGSQIVFKYYQRGWDHNELHTANADGTNEQVLWVGDNSTNEEPDWGP